MSQTILIVQFLILTLSAQQVLLDESFKQTTFTDLQGWILYSKKVINNGIGSSSDNVNYAGLGSISFSTLFPEDSIYKYYHNIPPHKALRIKMNIYGTNNVGYTILAQPKIYINGQFTYMSQHSQRINQNQFNLMVDVTSPHSLSQAVIAVIYTSNDFVTQSMGIRDYQLYYIKCPNNCLTCSTDDDIEYTCNQWVLTHTSLLNLGQDSYSNDGWNIYQQDSLQPYSIAQCQDKINFQIFGLLTIDQKIRKTLILPPHYAVNIQYTYFLIQAPYSRITNWAIEINNKVLFQIDFQTLLKVSAICSQAPQKSQYNLGDIFQGTTLKLNHQNTTLIFTTYANPNPLLASTTWTIRGFEVYVKKCHSSCTACNGPSEIHCLKIPYPNFIDINTYFDQDTFTDVDTWQAITPIQLKSPNLCNKVSVLGGFNQLQGEHYIQRIVNLPVHVNLDITFKLYRIDNFDNDILYVVVDDVIVYQYTLVTITDSTLGVPLCGKYEVVDQMILIKIPQFAHTQQQSIIQMYTNQAATSIGYWGIRDFQLKANSKVIFKEMYLNQFDSTNWQTDDWLQTAKLPPIGLCNGKNIIGGLNGLGYISKLRKINKNLQEHIQIRLKFTLIIYSSNSGQSRTLNIKLDDQSPIKKVLQLQDSQLCGQKSSIFIFDEIISHSNSQAFLLLWIDSLLNTEYWGVREVLLQYNNQGLS